MCRTPLTAVHIMFISPDELMKEYVSYDEGGEEDDEEESGEAGAKPFDFSNEWSSDWSHEWETEE